MRGKQVYYERGFYRSVKGEGVVKQTQGNRGKLTQCTYEEKSILRRSVSWLNFRNLSINLKRFFFFF